MNRFQKMRKVCNSYSKTDHNATFMRKKEAVASRKFIR